MHTLSAKLLSLYPIKFRDGYFYIFNGEKVVKTPYEDYLKKNENLFRLKKTIIGGKITDIDFIGKTEPKEYLIYRRNNFGDLTMDNDMHGENPCKNIVYVNGTPLNENFQNRMKHLIQEGDTYHDVFMRAYDTQKQEKELAENRERKKSSLERRFITKVEKPIHITVPTAEDGVVSDEFQIILYTCQEWPNKTAYIKEHLPEIVNIAKEKLVHSSYFKKIDVPISCFRVSSSYYREDNAIVISFRIKEDIENALYGA